MRIWSAMLVIASSALSIGAATAAPVCVESETACLRAEFEHGAAMGNTVAQIELARLLLAEPQQDGNWRRAADLLAESSATGDPWSTSILAGLYIEGRGVPEDGRKVLSLLIPSAAKGSVAALSGLGDLFARGAGAIAAEPARAARYYERAAAEGDMHGKYRLALMLLDGKGIPADVDRAIALLEDLSAGGDPWILIQLADVYASGKAKPAERAIHYLDKAVAKDHAPAMVRLAQLYQSGIGAVAPDAGKAAGLLERSASLGNAGGQVLLAQMLLKSGKVPDATRAVGLLEQAAATGDAWATTILADMLIRGDRVQPDGARALALLKPLADADNAAALAGLGNLYTLGAGSVRPDPAKAATYLEAAAALGDYGAKSRLGMMLVKGDGAEPGRGLALLRDVAAIGDGWAKIQLGDVLVSGGTLPVDPDGALSAYEAAREAGLPAGAIKLGYLYLTGKGDLMPDPARAARYFEEAAMSGESVGQISLALLLLDGKGVPRDVDRAVNLLEKAAATGDAWANGTLGGLYADGRHVKPQYEQALQYSEAAAKAGDPAATLRLGMLLATGPLAGERRDEGIALVQSAIDDGLPGARVERARLRMMGLIGTDGGVTAAEELQPEVEAGNPAALRLLLQLYRSGGPGLKASPRQAQALLDEHGALLPPEARAFETIALRAVPPASEQSLAAIGALLDELAPSDLSQTVQMLFWGNKNAYVYVLQSGLRDAGLYAGPLNGLLTRPTIAAINRLCASQGVAPTCASGPLTPGVAVFLGDYLASRPAPPPVAQATI
jgi:TPR repeat protein